VAELLPLVKRTGGLTVEYVAGSMVEAYEVFELLALASSGYDCDFGSNIALCVGAGALREELCGRRRQLTLKVAFYHVVGCFEQLYLNTQAQSVCSLLQKGLWLFWSLSCCWIFFV
jgi:hypothetical protein